MNGAVTFYFFLYEKNENIYILVNFHFLKRTKNYINLDFKYSFSHETMIWAYLAQVYMKK